MKVSTYRNGRHVREEWRISGHTRILRAEVWSDADDLAVRRWQIAMRVRDGRAADGELVAGIAKEVG